MKNLISNTNKAATKAIAHIQRASEQWKWNETKNGNQQNYVLMQ